MYQGMIEICKWPLYDLEVKLAVTMLFSLHSL